MKITFWGAAGDVTGSLHQLSTGGHEYLLDCGMYQGRRKEAELQNRTFPFPAASIDAVMLSHAHIDHSGNLPLLVKNGFHGTIYATSATVDLCRAMLADTAHIQEQDARFLARHKRPGDAPVTPLYTQADADATMPLFRRVDYYRETDIAEGLRYKLFDAGHMLGSSTMVLEADGVRLAFSGDVGRPGLPIVRDPDSLPAVDYLIMAANTLGSKLLNHVPVVNILNEQKHVRCAVESLQALSGHADRDELLKWIEPIAKTLKKVFLVHGEADQSAALAQTIQRTYGVEAVPAVRGVSVMLSK